MSWKKLLLACTVGLCLGCYPTVPSDACKAQMSECLKRCDPEIGAIDRTPYPASHGNHSTCERLCENCSISSASAAPPIGAGATGTTPPIPPGAVSPPNGVVLSAPDAGPGTSDGVQK